MSLPDDGLYLPEVKTHSLEKIRRHNYYAAIFSKSMHKRWPQRAYIGLYSGAGRALIKSTGEIVETSALAVCRQQVPFTKYIFVDQDPRCLSALSARIEALDLGLDVTTVQKDVNEAVPDVLEAMPSYGPDKGLLSLCFIDPFKLDLKFSVIEALARYKIDFLIMLPFGYDARRNLRQYLEDGEDSRIGDLLQDPYWREQWREEGRSDRHFVRFLLEKFDEAMQNLGFLHRDWGETHDVKVTGMGVFLYSLALYSRSERARSFWKTTLSGTSDQIGLGL